MKNLIRAGLLVSTGQLNNRIVFALSRRFFAAHEFSRPREFHQSSAKGAVKPFLLADIGEGITECQIINWFVKAGDRVEQFDRICEVQSDKASVEITSRWDGRIKKLHYETDDMAVVGQPLLDIEVDEIEGGEITKDPAGNELISEDIIAQENQERAGSEPETSQILRTIQAAATGVNPASQPFKPKTQDTGSSLLIPSVRHMLKDLDIDVDEIRGTGRNGRINKEDVLRYHLAKESQSSTGQGEIQETLELTSAPATSPVTTAQDRLIPLSPIARMMFKTMTNSLKIPHFLYTHTVDLTSIIALRKSLNASLTDSFDARLTILPFMIKAISQAFVQMPQLNAHLDTDTDPEKPRLLLRGHHNFGIAIDTPQGLLVPVIKNVQAHSVKSLAAEILRLNTLANEAKLGMDDFKDATFTVSNIGSIGGGTVSPIIVAPQVGILGIGRIQAVPRFQQDGKTGEEVLVRREEVVLSWSADHRVLDGATVARCAEAVSELLRNWAALGVMLK